MLRKACENPLAVEYLTPKKPVLNAQITKLTPEAMNWIKLRMKVLKDLIKRVPAAEL